MSDNIVARQKMIERGLQAGLLFDQGDLPEGVVLAELGACYDGGIGPLLIFCLDAERSTSVSDRSGQLQPGPWHRVDIEKAKFPLSRIQCTPRLGRSLALRDCNSRRERPQRRIEPR